MFKAKVKPPVAADAAAVNNRMVSMKASTLAVNTAIEAFTTASASFGVSADNAVRLAISHCEEFNDPSGVQRLYEATGKQGKIIGPRRQKQMMKFIKAFTPIRLNSKTENFGLIKATAPNYVAYDMDSVASISWLDFENETAERVLKMDMDKMAESIAKRMFKQMNEAQWPTDGAFNRASVMRKITANFKALEQGAAAAADA